MKKLEIHKKAIYRIKVAIVNEFRYYYGEYGIGGMFSYLSSDNSLTMDIQDLQESSLITIDFNLRENIKKKELEELFHESLVELFQEGLVVFLNDKTVAMTSKSEKLFFDDCILYSEYNNN